MRIGFFDLRRPCDQCPFRLDGLLLGERTARRVMADHQDDRNCFPCHKTTTALGRSMQHPQAKYCAGSMLHLLARQRPAVYMRVGMALQAWHPDQLDRTVAVLETSEAFIRHHARGGV